MSGLPFRAAVWAACFLVASAQTQTGPNSAIGSSVSANNWAAMQSAGWTMTGVSGLNNLGGRNRCARTSFHFYAGNANQARLRVTLQGSGCARIVFSNCWNTQNSFVGVWLGGTRIVRTMNTAPSGTITHDFNYTTNQVLEIRDEGNNAVAEIVSLVFLGASCPGGGQTGPNSRLGATLNANNWIDMQTAGWTLTGHSGLSNLNGRNQCGDNQFHFYAGNQLQGRLAATLQGQGCAEITFSNCWNTPNSFVGVWLGGTRIAQTVSTATPSPVVTFRFSYSNGQVLEIRDEGYNSVAEIDSLYFTSCGPTAPPTSAPTGWYQNQNLPDLTTMPSRMVQVEGQLVAMNATLQTAVANIYNLQGVIAGMQAWSSELQANTSTALQAQSAMMSQLASTTSSQQSQLSGTVSSVLTALRAAVQSAATGGGGSQPPQVSSTPANELVLTSGAAVRVSSGTCSNSDLCGAASFASALKQALAQV